MLQPKKEKYRKMQKGRVRGLACRGNNLSFGDFGLQSLEHGWISARQIESTRMTISRHVKRGGKLFLRIFPDKPITKKPLEVRMVADAIRGEKVNAAMDFLAFSAKGAAKPMAKLLKSAIVNASKEKGVDVDNLYIKELRVDTAPTLKRWMARARGMTSPILKRASHVMMRLEEK